MSFSNTQGTPPFLSRHPQLSIISLVPGRDDLYRDRTYTCWNNGPSRHTWTSTPRTSETSQRNAKTLAKRAGSLTETLELRRWIRIMSRCSFRYGPWGNVALFPCGFRRTDCSFLEGRSQYSGQLDRVSRSRRERHSRSGVLRCIAGRFRRFHHRVRSGERDWYYRFRFYTTHLHRRAGAEHTFALPSRSCRSTRETKGLANESRCHYGEATRTSTRFGGSG